MTGLRDALTAPFRALARIALSDVIALAGFCGVTYGLLLIYEPAAWIGGGSLLMAFGVLAGVSNELDRRRARESETDRDAGAT